MATVCTACGTENREKARFCRGCARPLGPLGLSDATAEPAADATHPHHKIRRSHSGARRGARQGQTALRGGVALVMLLVGLFIWRPWSGDEAVQAASATVAPAPQALPAVPVSAPAEPMTWPTTPTVAKVTTFTSALPKADPPVPPAKTAAAQRPRPVPVRPVEAGSVSAPARAEPVAPVSVVTPAPAAVVAPVRSRSVDETCADSSNFFSRDLCRIRACGNPALAGDPVCVRFREMEEANRNRAAN
jgi:hypothetical protein